MICIACLIAASSLSSAAEQTEYGDLSSDQFEESARCSTCHGILYSQWDGSIHSNSHSDPFYQKDFQVASEDTDGQIEGFCIRCHTPIGFSSGEIPPVDEGSLSDVAAEGINCDFCHSISDSAGIGNAGYVLTPGEVKWGPYSDSQAGGHETAYLELQTRSEYCGICHQVIHPENGIVLDDTYTSWKEGPYSQEGVQCQDCHMSPGITGFEANPGRAGSGGPKREHISTHYFVGANAFVTEMIGEDDHRDMAIERLQKAATLNVSLPQTAQENDTVELTVSITNSGAGHKLPTGVTDLRQMWVEVTVTDDSGNVIYSSGSLDESGRIDPGAKIYRTVLEDAQGDPTEKFWLAENLTSDNRIPPRQTDSQEHRFTVPADVEYPLTVDTKLKYRSASQDLIDELFGEGLHEVPVIVMAEISNQISDPDTPPSQETSTPGFGAVGLAVALLMGALFIIKRKK